MRKLGRRKSEGEGGKKKNRRIEWKKHNEKYESIEDTENRKKGKRQKSKKLKQRAQNFFFFK